MSENFTAVPAGWVTVSTVKVSGLFLAADTLSFTLSAATASTYEVRDYDGNTVRSGSVSGTTLTLAALSLGWYRLVLYRTATDATYGNVIGTYMFSILTTDARLAAPPVAGTVVGGDLSYVGQDHIMRGLSLIGPYRNQINDATAPTTTGNSISRTQDDRVYQRSWYEANADSVRPRPAFLQFPNGGYQTGSHTAGVTSVVSTLYPDIGYYEGPTNEPDMNNASVATWMQTFKTAVKAGNASAKVMGPNPVEITGNLIGAFDNFLANGGAAGLDALSFHAYNAVDGDIVLGRRTMDAFVKMLASRGFGSTELWQTEWGQFAATFGILDMRRQCRWWAMHRFVMDQYGVPKERDYWFYDTSHGFWSYSSFWKLEDGAVLPMIAMARVYSQELFGKSWTSKLDFGTVENDHYIGSKYTAADGSAVLTLLSGGRTDGSVNLSVTGASSLTVLNRFGTTSTVTVTGGLATIPVNLEPTYVRLPVGVTASPAQVFYGADLALNATAAGSGATAYRINNGVLENSYYSTSGFAEYQETTALPSVVSLTFPSSRMIDTVVVHCPTPWQTHSTLLDFDVEYKNSNGIWNVLRSITEPTVTYAVVTGSAQGATRFDCYHSGRSSFVISLTTPVYALGVRLTVRDTTAGGEATDEALAAGGQGATKRLCIRAISCYCRAPISRRRLFASKN